jgi:hypothetical protein
MTASLIPFAAIMAACILLVVAQIPKIVSAQRTYKRRMREIDAEFLAACAADLELARKEGRA